MFTEEEKTHLDALYLTSPIADVVDLDLTTAPLFVFETGQEQEDVDRMVETVRSGQFIRPIVVAPLIEEGSYTLTRSTLVNGRYANYTDGGHHRSIAHFLLRKPIRAAILDVPRSFHEEGRRLKQHVDAMGFRLT